MDCKIQSHLVYFWLNGRYLNKKGEVVEEATAKEELKEDIYTIEVFYGSRVNYELL